MPLKNEQISYIVAVRCFPGLQSHDDVTGLDVQDGSLRMARSQWWLLACKSTGAPPEPLYHICGLSGGMNFSQYDDGVPTEDVQDQTLRNAEIRK